MKLPLDVTAGERTHIEGVTRDLSARGVFFYLDVDGFYEDTVEFTVLFPEEITGYTSLMVRCTGRVVRVETERKGRVGIAAEIRRYEFVRTAEA